MLHLVYMHICIPANPQDKPNLSQMSSGREQTIVMEDLV